MLSVLATRNVRPETEAFYRDPGIVTFVAALVRGSRRGVGALVGHVRAAHQRANEAELFSSSSAWPYKHRTR